MPNAEHERVVGRRFDDLFAPDFVARGREAFRERLRWYTSAFAERGWTVHDHICEGEKVVARN